MRILNIEEIEERCNAATEGPWYVPSEMNAMDNGWTVCSDAEVIVDQPDTRYNEDQFRTEADAEFIAHAKTDIPALISRVRDLERENEQLYASGLENAQMIGKLEAENEGLCRGSTHILELLGGDMIELANMLHKVKELETTNADLTLALKERSDRVDFLEHCYSQKG